MTRVLMLGANGRIARLVTGRLLDETDYDLRLFLRKPERLRVNDSRVDIVGGDTADAEALAAAVSGCDIVYSAVGPYNELQSVRNVIAAMESAGVRRLIDVSALGIHDEVPGAFGRWNLSMVGSYMDAHKEAARLIEASGLDYTILRLAWLTDYDEVDYETTKKGEPFRGTEVSRKSAADLTVRLITEPGLYSRESIGVDKPGTDGDKPAFY